MSADDFDFPADPFADAPAAATKATDAPKLEGERIHVTGVDRWLECGYRAEQYRRRAWFEPVRPELIRGRAVHAARELALKAALRGKDMPPVEDCEARADAFVHEEVKHALDAGDDTMADEVAALADEARLYVRADRLGVLPDLAPHVIEVETTIEVPVAGNGLTGQYVLTGRPDAIARSPIDGRLSVPDLKTSNRAPSVASVNASTQHSLYSALIEGKFGTPPVHSIDHVRILKTKPRSALKPNQRLIDIGTGTAVLTQIPTVRTPDDIAAAVRKLRFVLDAREQGFAPPAQAGFQSPCDRCVHRGAADSQQRCPWVPATRAGEEVESDE